MIVISSMKEGEELEIYQLYSRVFYEHIAPLFSNREVASFLAKFPPECLAKMSLDRDGFVLTAKDDEIIVGMLAVIKHNTIALIFCDSKYKDKNIGKKLIEESIERCLKKVPTTTSVTVNATPNSVNFFKNLGFSVHKKEIDREGMYFTLMQKQI